VKGGIGFGFGVFWGWGEGNGVEGLWVGWRVAVGRRRKGLFNKGVGEVIGSRHLGACWSITVDCCIDSVLDTSAT